MPSLQLPRTNFFLGAALALSAASAWAQSGTVQVRVSDGQTGFAVPGAQVAVQGPAGAQQRLATTANGRLSLGPAPGTYALLVSAPGYAPLQTRFQTGNGQTLNAEIQLDPLQPRADEPAANAPLRAPGQTALTGYVSDRESGRPLAGVQVQLGAATAFSDAQGRYRLVVPAALAPAAEPGVKQVATVTFAKTGYGRYQLQNFRLIDDAYTLKTSLEPAAATDQRAGGAPAPTETEVLRHGFFDKKPTDQPAAPEPAAPAGAARPNANPGLAAAAAITVPSSIRVGTNCSCNSCSSVVVMSLESYVQSGLDDEWIASWGANSLRAGSIAYRSYAANNINNPIAANYDISNTTCRQVWQPGIATSAKNAALDTQGQVLQKNGAIAFTEYSAETNNSGCGDGYSGTGTSVPVNQRYPCIADAVCAGTASNGHGRGMCQWGTQRWSLQGKTYPWIIDHYYGPAGITLYNNAADTQAPTTSIAGPSSATGNFTVTFADADNVGVAERFYQPLEWRTNEWRANRGNGFYNDNFGTGALHPDYVLGGAGWQGTWAETTAGTLRQTDVAATNTGLSTFLSQTNGNTYLYDFAARLNNASGARRFGLHIMADDATLPQRGNSYLIWFAADGQTAYIYETVANVLNARASAPISLAAGAWNNIRASYNTGTGTVNVYLNGNLVVSWTDTTPLTAGANISLRTNEADVDFDDLKVFKARSGTSALITVGSANTNDVRTSASPGAKIKSLVRDAANNWSTLGNLDVNIAIPAGARPTAAFAAALHPNPATAAEAPTLTYALDAPAQVVVEVYSDLGVKLHTQVQQAEAGPQQLRLASDALPRRGTYFVKVSANGKYETVRLVKE